MTNVLPLAIAVAAALLAALAERWHERRCQAVARLAFGPAAAPRVWTRARPLLCALAAGLMAWGLMILARLEPQSLTNTNTAEGKPSEAIQRVVILLDVSPSMNIADSGEHKNQRRRDRVLDITEGILSRIALARTRFSVIAFFTSAQPVVVDASDVAVIRNVLDNLPLVWAFKPGETQLLEAVRSACELAQDWPPDSTTLLICTDGDTTDFSRIPKLPSSIHKVDILAVGDPVVGTFIHNHDSRQQAGILRRLAAELGGSYYDANTRHVPSSALADLAYTPPPPPRLGLGLKDFALLAVAVGTLICVLLPLALEYLGSSWQADRELPEAADAGTPAQNENVREQPRLQEAVR